MSAIPFSRNEVLQLLSMTHEQAVASGAGERWLLVQSVRSSVIRDKAAAAKASPISSDADGSPSERLRAEVRRRWHVNATEVVEAANATATAA